jgi:carotenoid cleavage dioxygenase-like enzyme
MSIDGSKFRGSIPTGYYSQDVPVVEGTWPENLAGCIFIVAPYHRPNDRHLFTGEGVIIKWELQPQAGKIKLHSKKLKTWDGFWRCVQNKILSQAFFPARLSVFGVAEIANTAIANLNGRLILTADAGRYWEVDPNTLETITPLGYFDEHIVSIPLSFFPLVANTAHPFFDSPTKKLITCELKFKPRHGDLFTDMVSSPYISIWDWDIPQAGNQQQTGVKHWKLAGTELDGSPHTTIVTEQLILIPDMPFQMGVTMILGLKIPPRKAYPKTQMYVVNRQDLKEDQETVASRLITFDGDSYHFLCNYHHIDDTISLVAIQQATISLTEAIQPGDVRHFTGDRYGAEYYGLPWMFGFDPGVLRKVVIKGTQLIHEEVLMHPGWYNTMLYTADTRELYAPTGYSAIYQVYAGYDPDLICRRHYLSFRNHENRVLTDEQLPFGNLPSVLAKIPLDLNWQELTQKIQLEQEQNVERPLADLGKEILDFYVCPEGYTLDSIQFIPQDQGYLFTTVLTPGEEEVWLFAADCLHQGAIAKLSLGKEIGYGFSLHSEYFNTIEPRTSKYNVNRAMCALRSLTKVPYEYIFKQP